MQINKGNRPEREQGEGSYGKTLVFKAPVFLPAFKQRHF